MRGYFDQSEESAMTVVDGRLHCRERRARIKLPVLIQIVGTLPKNSVGKIDKPALRSHPVPAA